MEEINLKEMLDYFKEKILYIILIISVVCALGSLYVVFFQVDSYTSSTSLILAGFNNTNTTTTEGGITQSEVTINQKLVTTYQQIAKSRKVLEQVIEELSLEVEVGDLANQITVASVADTEIIKISVTDTDPITAYEIAKSLAEVFSNEIKNIYKVSNISILDQANIATHPSNMSFYKQLAIFFVVGFVLAFAIVFLIFYFDTTVKSVEQVEGKIKYPIIGKVPDYTKKKRGTK